MHPIVLLAKNAIELYVREGKTLPVKTEELAPELKEQTAVFVSIKIKGALRGCIGTVQPTEPTVVHEIVRNAISAATRDPRFPCVTREELHLLEYSVDVLTPPAPVQDENELDPKRFGVIVEAGGRRGLLLPDLEGVDTVDEQIGIAMRKAGIPRGTSVALYRFEVKRYH